MTVRTLAEGRAPGAANMSRDRELALLLERGEIPPTIRVYGWEPPAVSIGFHQREEDFDAARLARSGIHLVRRPTGGRAILHDHEVTYCAVMPLSLGPPRAIYRMLNEALLDGILAMGIPAALSGSGADLRRAYAGAEGIPCFSVSVKSEIQVGGRKIVGSAQRRYGRTVLQHGSFLLGARHRDLAGYLRSAEGDAASAVAAGLALRTTEAETVLGRPVTFDEAATALAAGFTRYFSRVPEPRESPGRRPESVTLHA
jgi:lipoate-protein ligase A